MFEDSNQGNKCKLKCFFMMEELSVYQLKVENYNLKQLKNAVTKFHSVKGLKQKEIKYFINIILKINLQTHDKISNNINFLNS